MISYLAYPIQIFRLISRCRQMINAPEWSEGYLLYISKQIYTVIFHSWSMLRYKWNQQALFCFNLRTTSFSGAISVKYKWDFPSIQVWSNHKRLHISIIKNYRWDLFRQSLLVFCRCYNKSFISIELVPFLKKEKKKLINTK